MKKRKCVILVSLVLVMSFFVVFSVIAGYTKDSDITLLNVEALSINESSFSPCNVAGGCCFMNNLPYAGIQVAKD